MRLLCVVMLGVAMLWPPSASAMKCSQWARLTYDQKYDGITRMIDDAVAGQRGRQYRVNRNAVGRCLDGQIQNILYDFDDTCSDSRRSGMQALNNIFKNYIWSCAG